MKKLWIILAVLASAVTASADDYPYLIFRMADGTKQPVAVEGLEITVADGQLVVTNGDGTQTFELENLVKMFFSTDETAVVMELPSQQDKAVEVFSVQGVSMGRFDTLDDARAKLVSGIYVVKTGGSTFKIAVK